MRMHTLPHLHLFKNFDDLKGQVKVNLFQTYCTIPSERKEIHLIQIVLLRQLNFLLLFPFHSLYQFYFQIWLMFPFWIANLIQMMIFILIYSVISTVIIMIFFPKFYFEC